MKARFPKLTDSARKGKIGLDFVSHVANDELRWLFRINPGESDFGIDGYLDVVSDNGSVTGQSIAVQIKCGESYLRERTAVGYVFHGEHKHLNYYLNSLLPVLIVLCNPDNGKCFWEQFDPRKTEATRGGWKLIVPFSQVFGPDSRDALLRIVGPAHDHTNALEQHWALTRLIKTADRIYYAVSRPDIESGSIEGVCDFFDRLQANLDLCTEVQGKVDVSVSGYDQDSRELWEIADVRHWFALALPAVKYWFYFLTPSRGSGGLKLLLVCLSDPKRGAIVDASGNPQVLLDPIKMSKLLEACFIWLNEMTDRMGMPLEKNKEISFAVMDLFDIPHESL